MGSKFKAIMTILTIRLITVVSGDDTWNQETLHVFRFIDGSVSPLWLQVSFSFYHNNTCKIDFINSTPLVDLKAIHVFIANDNREIQELQFKKGNQTIVNLYEAPHVLKKTHEITTDRQDLIVGSLTINANTALSNPSRISAAAKTEGSDIVCFYSLTNSPISKPDLMVYDKFKTIGGLS